MKKYRVLVVDDSSFMRKVIRELIDSDPQLEVVGIATNGEEATLLNHVYLPDCITLDVEMPVMDGLTALKQIMKERPVPVIMLSSLTQDGRETTIEALLHGAVDYVPKPSGALSLNLTDIKDTLLIKIKNAVQAKLAPLIPHSMLGQTNRWLERQGDHFKLSSELVCIGSSTGGPRALQTVLSQLPRDLSAPVLVVQHMPATFTTTLAARLNQSSKLTVKEAEDGDTLLKGLVYIAPGGRHMRVEKKGERLVIALDDSPPVKGLRPCYDYLLKSLIPFKPRIVYAVLTGMGSDGSNGLIAIKEALKVHAIAESEASSVIFGMPKASIQTGLVDEILNITDIAPKIVDQLVNIRG